MPEPAVEPAPLPSPTPEVVFREYAPRIYYLARRMLGNDADAEDVTSEVLLQVVRKLDTYRGEAALPTWLHRVTVNAALAFREKRAKLQHREHATDDENAYDMAEEPGSVKLPHHGRGPSPDAVALATEQRALIDRAIARLPAMYRDVYVLADVEGLSNPEIAEMLGLEVPAVKSRLHRARLRMRDALAPHFEEAKS